MSLDLHPDELVAIMGPSGSGESTFLLIAGLIDRPTRGEIRFEGRPVSGPACDPDRLRALRRGNIGFVFQKANLIPYLTAAENVAAVMEMDGVASSDALTHAIRLLDALGLTEVRAEEARVVQDRALHRGALENRAGVPRGETEIRSV
ncbi:ATP-binding cassette domain-containing protein [Rubrimonas cliftonensis]|uniref:ATP-binding cassette domain-containing protein n=1 Tax=Rubrimonas cliftonensis TaxID=89524 RepID=UPI003CCBF300